MSQRDNCLKDIFGFVRIYLLAEYDYWNVSVVRTQLSREEEVSFIEHLIHLSGREVVHRSSTRKRYMLVVGYNADLS